MSEFFNGTVDRKKPVLGDFVWMDRNMRYFIFTGGSTDIDGERAAVHSHAMEERGNTDPNMVELTIPQTITEEIYYITCGQIDRHNRCRQESLDIKILGTKYLSKRVNLSVFAMNMVNVWLAYQGITRTEETQADLYNYTAEDMIDNI